MTTEVTTQSPTTLHLRLRIEALIAEMDMAIAEVDTILDDGFIPTEEEN